MQIKVAEIQMVRWMWDVTWLAGVRNGYIRCVM